MGKKEGHGVAQRMVWHMQPLCIVVLRAMEGEQRVGLVPSCNRLDGIAIALRNLSGAKMPAPRFSYFPPTIVFKLERWSGRME